MLEIVDSTARSKKDRAKARSFVASFSFTFDAAVSRAGVKEGRNGCKAPTSISGVVSG